MEGLNRALSLSQQLAKRNLEYGNWSRLCYYRGNAYYHLFNLDYSGGKGERDYEYLQNSIYCFRAALIPEGLAEIERYEACQIYVNLANQISITGRIIEAIQYWDYALKIDPNFSTAKGNKGIELSKYARLHYDEGHSYELLRSGYIYIEEALKDRELHPEQIKAFEFAKKKY